MFQGLILLDYKCTDALVYFSSFSTSYVIPTLTRTRSLSTGWKCVDKHLHKVRDG